MWLNHRGWRWLYYGYTALSCVAFSLSLLSVTFTKKIGTAPPLWIVRILNLFSYSYTSMNDGGSNHNITTGSLSITAYSDLYGIFMTGSSLEDTQLSWNQVVATRFSSTNTTCQSPTDDVLNKCAANSIIIGISVWIILIKGSGARFWTLLAVWEDEAECALWTRFTGDQCCDFKSRKEHDNRAETTIPTTDASTWDKFKFWFLFITVNILWKLMKQLGLPVLFVYVDIKSFISLIYDCTGGLTFSYLGVMYKGGSDHAGSLFYLVALALVLDSYHCLAKLVHYVYDVYLDCQMIIGQAKNRHMVVVFSFKHAYGRVWPLVSPGQT